MNNNPLPYMPISQDNDLSSIPDSIEAFFVEMSEPQATFVSVEEEKGFTPSVCPVSIPDELEAFIIPMQDIPAAERGAERYAGNYDYPTDVSAEPLSNPLPEPTSMNYDMPNSIDSFFVSMPEIPQKEAEKIGVDKQTDLLCYRNPYIRNLVTAATDKAAQMLTFFEGKSIIPVSMIKIEVKEKERIKDFVTYETEKLKHKDGSPMYSVEVHIPISNDFPTFEKVKADYTAENGTIDSASSLLESGYWSKSRLTKEQLIISFQEDGMSEKMSRNIPNEFIPKLKAVSVSAQQSALDLFNSNTTNPMKYKPILYKELLSNPYFEKATKQAAEMLYTLYKSDLEASKDPLIEIMEKFEKIGVYVKYVPSSEYTDKRTNEKKISQARLEMFEPNDNGEYYKLNLQLSPSSEDPNKQEPKAFLSYYGRKIITDKGYNSFDERVRENLGRVHNGYYYSKRNGDKVFTESNFNELTRELPLTMKATIMIYLNMPQKAIALEQIRIILNAKRQDYANSIQNQERNEQEEQDIDDMLDINDSR